MKDKISEIILEVLNQEELKESRESNSNWDSIAHLEIIMAIEEEFNVRFDTVEVATIQTVEQIVALVEEKTNA